MLDEMPGSNAVENVMPSIAVENARAFVRDNIRPFLKHPGNVAPLL